MVQLKWTSLLLLWILSAASCVDQAASHSSHTLRRVDPPDNNVLQTSSKLDNMHIDTSISLDYLMGKFNPAEHVDFVKIELRYADRPGMYLRKEAYQAFRQMYEAAKAAGVRLQIRSATRNFYRQKTIWEAKWKGQRRLEGGEDASKAYPAPRQRALRILNWSSMPGTSRHHWGTDIDLNNFTNAYFEKGKGLKEYEWLSEHAASFGFCQPYTAKGPARPDGYNEEKWHWSYIPLSQALTQQASLRLKDDMIRGFAGAEVAAELEVVKKYVLGINAACL